jgi:hypothetical protein
LTVPAGAGKFVFQSGAWYEGGWQHSKYHGQGAYHWSDGRHYEVSRRQAHSSCMRMQPAMMPLLGSYPIAVSDLRNRPALLTGHQPLIGALCLRACLQGEWVEGKMHGEGRYVDGEGHCWEGQFYNGAGPGLTCKL